MRVFLCLKSVNFDCIILLIDIIRITRNFFYELFELFLSIFAPKYEKISQNYIILAGLIILFTQGFFLF